MVRRLRPVSAIAWLALCACGLFGGDSTQGGGARDGPGAVAESPTGGASEPAPGATTEEVATPAPVQPGDTGSAPSLDALAGTDAAPEAEPPAGAPLEVDPQVTVTVEERLDRLLLGQDALARRIDSLAAAAPPTAPTVPAGVDSASVGTSSGEVLGEAGQSVRNFGVGVVWSIIVVTLFNLAIRGLVWVLDALAERNVSRRLFYKRIVPIARIVLWVFASYLIVAVIFHVDAQGLLAAAAAVGVAVGFAAQDLLKNLFGGLILVFDQPFQVGDKIRVGGTYGEVKSIGLRSTRIVTPDDNLVSVPNAQVVDQQVANANAGELNCQVVTDLFLPGWPDEATTKRIAFDAAASSKYVYLNKPIVVLVADQFTERFMTRVRVKAYVLDPRLEFLFQSDVTERARAGFRDAGLIESNGTEPHAVDGPLPTHAIAESDRDD